METIHLQNCIHGSKVRRVRSVVRRKDAIAIDRPRWMAFAAVNVRVSTVAKADVRGLVVVVVVVESGIVKRRAVKITLTCFNSVHIFWLLQFQCFSRSTCIFFPVDGT